MSDLEYAWPSTAFDAINVAMHDGEITLEGTDADQVELEVDGLPHSYDVTREPIGRWLQLVFWHTPAQKVRLRLPKAKSWVLDLSAGHGQVKLTDVQARLQVVLGKGEIEVENCRGVFNLTVGNGQIKMKRCAETEMPKQSPLPQRESGVRTSLPDRAIDPRREFRRRKIKPKSPWDWDSQWDVDWAMGGIEIADQASAWAQRFAQSFNWLGWNAQQDGINVQMGNGDAHLEDIEADTCSIRFGKGDVRLDQGCIANLQVSTGHGDIECKTVLPAGEWGMKTTHGDIHLALPADTQAKFDVATRHGDIHSNVALVRVARPGPEARYGRRMVGTAGQPGANAAEIGLTVMKGNIHIVLQSVRSRYTPKSKTKESAAVHPPTEGAPRINETDKPKDETPQSTYETPLTVLQALSEGRITVDEAERLLQSLGS